MFLRRRCRVLLMGLAISSAAHSPGASWFQLATNDIVAFVGGSDVASAQHTGHLESLCAVAAPGVRFRNFGWEGDTVFAQRRDFGFPPTVEHVKRAGAKLVFLQFGRGEALEGDASANSFYAAYEKLAKQYSQAARHIVLVTPAPFERSEGPLPDLSARNTRLLEYIRAINRLGTNHQWPVVNMFADSRGHLESIRLTSDGLQFTARGQALIAREFAQRTGLGRVDSRSADIRNDGSWSDPQLERLRHIAIEKNKLWFNYWRPHNWAFLGGDRTTQPSSRDHRDPKVRWFPAEMEKWKPLIEEKEGEMERVAAGLRGGQ